VRKALALPCCDATMNEVSIEVYGMLQPVLRVLALLVLLALLFFSVSVTVAWGEIKLKLQVTGTGLWGGLLPILIILWWRYFSIFGWPEFRLPATGR